MDTETTIILWASGGILSLISLVFGWFARQLWSSIQDLKSELNILKVEIGTNYVRYDRLKDMMEPIMDALTEIKDTLKNKADK